MIWLNGALVDAEAARIDPADRGFTLGDGLFETMLVQYGVVRQLQRHLDRLRRGVAVLGFPLIWSDSELADACAQIVAAQGQAHAALRLTLSRGKAPRGMLPPDEPSPTLVIAVGGPPSAETPVDIVFATVTRRNEMSPLAWIKSLSSLDNVLARQEAALHGADDALLLNTKGRVVELTIANLFVVLDGDLVTPPITDGAMPGIRRALVLDHCGAVERSLNPGDLDRVDEAFLTNSLSLRPVLRIGQRPVGNGAPGPVFETVRRKLESA